jgi:hypothetical protein
MRKFFSAIAVLVAALAAPAVAQQANGATAVVTMADPAAYAQQIANRMNTDGVSALRPALTELYANSIHVPVANAQLPPQWEAQFTTLQTLIAGRHAAITQKLSDVVLADTLRSIYYYHYYGDNVWVFTRFDFVRVGNGRWAVSLVLWGGDESVVGISPSITFQPVQPGSN